VLDVLKVSVLINRVSALTKKLQMKIELCLLTVNVLAGLAEVTWYLQSLPGEKKVTFSFKDDECGYHKQSRLCWLF
jgi:hypothetical protein